MDQVGWVLQRLISPALEDPASPPRDEHSWSMNDTMSMVVIDVIETERYMFSDCVALRGTGE